MAEGKLTKSLTHNPIARQDERSARQLERESVIEGPGRCSCGDSASTLAPGSCGDSASTLAPEQSAQELPAPTAEADDGPVAVKELTRHMPAAPDRQATSKTLRGPTPNNQISKLPEVVQKLWFGKKLYSKSFWADYWMVVRNTHILFSVFISHPLHPYRIRERTAILLSTVLFGYGVASVAAFIWAAIMDACDDCRIATESFFNTTVSHFDGRPPIQTRDVVMIIISIIIQAFYDTAVKALVRCDCAKHMSYERYPRALKIINVLQPFAGLIAFASAVVVATPIILALIASDLDSEHRDWANSITALQTWGISRGISWGGITMLVLLVLTWWGRRREYRRDFGKKRKLYGWTHAEDLPKYPPDMCLFCSYQPGACAGSVFMGSVMGTLVGVIVGLSLGGVQGAFLGVGFFIIIVAVGSVMVMTADDDVGVVPVTLAEATKGAPVRV